MSRMLLVFTAIVAWAQASDPGYTELDQAYKALSAKNYDVAVVEFQKAIKLLPDRPAIRKDLAYTYLKIGNNEAARDQFAEAVRLDPHDEHVALEYAFLCYETKQPVLARRVFDRYRKTNTTAAEAFENIDRPLREGIARWQTALAAAPDNFSGHEELAHLAEQRDELAVAAEHFEKAWRLRPARRDLLVDLGRVWNQVNRAEDGLAALLSASRSSEPRIAEQARELLPARYPYVYEFERALTLDPGNDGLRRELAYLHLQMNQPVQAEKQFEGVVKQSPDDLLSVAQLGLLKLARGDSQAASPLLNRVLAGNDQQLADRVRAALRPAETVTAPVAVPAVAPVQTTVAKTLSAPQNAASDNVVDAKQLAFKSLEKGYMKDALKYLNVAHENDPVDFDVILKLGWAYNGLKDDADALKWFNLARRSPDPKTAKEATKAYRNLAAGLARFRTTVWVSPTFSTRWHDLFAYAQAKTELRLPHWIVRPYLSVRWVGDAHDAVAPGAGFSPQYLSENAATVAIGATTNTWRGVSAWAEAGEQMRYRVTATNTSRMTPDYRGGVTFARGIGHMLTQGAHGFYGETNDDAVFVSHFDKDTLFYTQNRVGYTLREAESLGGFHAQLYWNGNLTADLKKQYWANYFETGPGFRFRFERMPNLLFSLNAMRGTYIVNTGNPRGANFTDLRIGVWYAFTR